MANNFEVEFLREVLDFLDGLDKKARQKILYNIDKAKVQNDNTLFNKLNSNIWEFRTQFGKKQYRLFAFWDKSNKTVTIVVATHGIVKKSQKTPSKEIAKATEIMIEYFNGKK